MGLIERLVSIERRLANLFNKVRNSETQPAPTFQQVVDSGNTSIKESGTHFALIDTFTNSSATYGANSISLSRQDILQFTTLSDFGYFNQSLITGKEASLDFNEGLKLKSLEGGTTVNVKSDNTTALDGILLQFPNTSGTLPALKTGVAATNTSGSIGEIRVSVGFIYFCIAPNTWVRVIAESVF